MPTPDTERHENHDLMPSAESHFAEKVDIRDPKTDDENHVFVAASVGTRFKIPLKNLNFKTVFFYAQWALNAFLVAFLAINNVRITERQETIKTDIAESVTKKISDQQALDSQALRRSRRSDGPEPREAGYRLSD